MDPSRPKIHHLKNQGEMTIYPVKNVYQSIYKSERGMDFFRES